MVHMAMKIKKQLKHKSGSRFGGTIHPGSSSSWKLNWSKRGDKTVTKPREESHKLREPTFNKEKGI